MYLQFTNRFYSILELTLFYRFFQDLSGDQSQSSGVGVNSGFKAPCVMVSYEDLKSDIEIFKSALWTVGYTPCFVLNQTNNFKTFTSAL